MKYKNALRIFVYVYLVTVTHGTHIGQEKNRGGPEESPNENETEPTNKPYNLTGIKLNVLAKDENLQESASSTELEIKLNLEKKAKGSFDYEDDSQVRDLSDYIPSNAGSNNDEMKHEGSNCWMSLNAESLFNTMDAIDERYADMKNTIRNDVNTSDFNDKMLQPLLASGGVAVREMYRSQEHRQLIPAGLNLGGFCMMRMPKSILFFHRMKLRNDTHFRINYLHNDLADMVLTARLSLNDLHLRGAFERSVTDPDPSILYYAPSFGQVDLLLKNVEYKMEGRYRIIKERLVIEVLISEVLVNDILMTYVNGALENPSIRIEKDNIAEFMERMKTDLDKWLKDYFNDFLIYTELAGISQLDKLEKYDKEKAIALNEYMDNALEIIRKRIRDRTAAVKLPNFTILGRVDEFQIVMHNGVFRGLDSIYRRSVATTNTHNDVRKVDSIVGFSDLKVTYQYEAKMPNNLPPVPGVLTLSANELAAHLSLTMVKSPESVDIDIDFMDQTRPESLTVEGFASTMIANFKHLLEHQIISIMSNLLMHGIRRLKHLPSCEPFLPGQILSEKLSNLNADDNYIQQTDIETTDVENTHFLRTKRHSKDFRKYNRRSKNRKKSSKRKSKHSKKKGRSYKKRNRGSKRKNKHGHKRSK